MGHITNPVGQCRLNPMKGWGEFSHILCGMDAPDSIQGVVAKSLHMIWLHTRCTWYMHPESGQTYPGQIRENIYQTYCSRPAYMQDTNSISSCLFRSIGQVILLLLQKIYHLSSLSLHCGPFLFIPCCYPWLQF